MDIFIGISFSISIALLAWAEIYRILNFSRVRKGEGDDESDKKLLRNYALIISLAGFFFCLMFLPVAFFGEIGFITQLSEGKTNFDGVVIVSYCLIGLSVILPVFAYLRLKIVISAERNRPRNI